MPSSSSRRPHNVLSLSGSHIIKRSSWLVTLTFALVALASVLSAAEANERLRRSALSTPLGKRITSMVAELGKRPKELYSFGIGKRSISAEEMAAFMAEENAAQQQQPSRPVAASQRLNDITEDDAEDTEDTEAGLQKRDPYSFGLGKRAEQDSYSFGLGKRGANQAYSFGMGKRSPNQAYSFGMGKRGQKQAYAFGMGKRRPAEYGFGLGKREPYGFGLGKRDPYAFGLGKRDPYAFGLGKRAPYNFGLGRKRDPYAFGLGKRDPYNFGLGKK